MIYSQSIELKLRIKTNIKVKEVFILIEVFVSRLFVTLKIILKNLFQTKAKDSEMTAKVSKHLYKRKTNE